MQFSRVGEHTIRCVISEEEIQGLGFSLDDIMSNSERTQEFMNRIFDLAEREFAMKFDLGVKTVRADFLPDHNISLTFSEHQNSTMMEHLKDIVNGMLNSIPQDKWDEMKNQAQSVMDEAAAVGKKIDDLNLEDTNGDIKEEEVDDLVEIIAMVTFESFEYVERFAKQVKMVAIPDSRLYKLKDSYILAMDLTGYNETEVLTLSMLTDEYCNQIEVGRERLAMLEEHASILIEENAIETLQEF